MAVNLRHRNFLKELDFTPHELLYLINLASRLKAAKAAGYEKPRLTGRNIALIFEKTSTRTRAAFEVAAHDQGAHVTCLGPDESQIGKKESIKDTARVLGRMFDRCGRHRDWGSCVWRDGSIAPPPAPAALRPGIRPSGR